MTESILNGTQLDEVERTRTFGLGTALFITSLDLLVDFSDWILACGSGKAMALKLPRSKGQTVGTVSRYCI
jgi:hypothetical protein